MSFKKLCAFVGSMIIGMIGINTDAHAYKLTEDDCMALATYKEARGEPIIGQAAVIKVILNRMKHREFPSTACGVVFQRTVKVCQFSWACSKVTLPSAEQLAPFYDVVRMVKNGTFDMILSDRILFFRSRRMRGGWNYRHIATFGNHKFFALS